MSDETREQLRGRIAALEEELKNKERQRQYWQDRAVRAQSEVIAARVFIGPESYERVRKLAEEKARAEADLHDLRQDILAMRLTADQRQSRSAETFRQKLNDRPADLRGDINVLLNSPMLRAIQDREFHNDKAIELAEYRSEPSVQLREMLSLSRLTGINEAGILLCDQAAKVADQPQICLAIMTQIDQHGKPDRATVRSLEQAWMKEALKADDYDELYRGLCMVADYEHRKRLGEKVSQEAVMSVHGFSSRSSFINHQNQLVRIRRRADQAIKSDR